jgi:hypothetical protein
MLAAANKNIADQVAGRLSSFRHASSEVALAAKSLSLWSFAQAFDSTPYAPDTLRALQEAGFRRVAGTRTLWTRPGAVARVVPLPDGMRGSPSARIEAIVSAAIKEDPALGIDFCLSVPSTGFRYESFLPARKTPAFAVPGLSIDVLGFAQLGVLVSGAVEQVARARSGELVFVLTFSLGLSMLRVGKSAVDLGSLRVPLLLPAAMRPRAAPASETGPLLLHAAETSTSVAAEATAPAGTESDRLGKEEASDDAALLPTHRLPAGPAREPEPASARETEHAAAIAALPVPETPSSGFTLPVAGAQPQCAATVPPAAATGTAPRQRPRL